ncbi:serine hydrolase domain-containing protein [Streptomyces sp. NPDC002867]
MAPAPPRLGSASTGDADLTAQVREAAGDGRGYRGISVAVVDGGSLRLAGLGDSGNPAHRQVDSSTVFEAGSVGKPMTGMLLADLADRGTLDLGTPLEQLLPGSRFADTAVAGATLEDLATHRAGLEKMPSDLGTATRTLRLRLLGQDPYQGLGEEEVLAAAGTSSARTPGTYAYSNLGMALAGYAAARRTGRPYGELLTTRLFAPLGMSDSRIVRRGDPEPPGTARGQQATGPSTDHWYASGYTPAGDVWTTGRDLGRFLYGVMKGTAPGARAAVPTHDAGPQARTGLGWVTTTLDGHAVTWHSGATGGFTSYIAFDRETGRGVAVLSNTDRPVDAIGQRLLGVSATGPRSAGTGHALGTALATLAAPLPLLVTGLVPGFPGARRRVLAGIHALSGAAALWLTWRLGDWLSLPPALWTAGAAVMASGFLFTVGRTGGRCAHTKRAKDRTTARTTAGAACRVVTVWAGALAVLLAHQL